MLLPLVGCGPTPEEAKQEANSPAVGKAREEAATVMPHLAGVVGGATDAVVLGHGWFDVCAAAPTPPRLLDGPVERLTCSRHETSYFGTSRNAAASMIAMDAAAASVGLTPSGRSNNHHSSFSAIPGGLAYATIDGSAPGRLVLGWGSTDRMDQPIDVHDAPADPSVAFFQAKKANVASWWPAASGNYRYILKITASWDYYISSRADPIPSPTASVRPS